MNLLTDKIQEREAQLPPHTDAYRVADGNPWQNVFIDALADRLLVSLRDTNLPRGLKDMLAEIAELCPGKEFIFTVSPIRHFKDGAHGNQLSKSTLLLGINEFLKEFHGDYFPAYEIVMDELRDYRFYAEDMCHPSGQAVGYIGARFLNWALPAEEQEKLKENIRAWKHGCHISK